MSVCDGKSYFFNDVFKNSPVIPNNIMNTNGCLQENSQNAPLVHATLETLLRFLNWIPLGYIFETKLISTLIYKVLMQKLMALKFK